MQSLKDKAIETLSKLPETATADDIMYQIYVLEKIQKGQRAASLDEVLSEADVRKAMAKW
ncbi:MAG: hypothetical protein HS115_11860 [Spirochaetales bacterium]|nr:hypothetical protein [Spirochaetales bacterium]